MGGLQYALSQAIGGIAVLETADIGGTNAQVGTVDMRQFANVFAYAEIGTWDAGDDLDECRLEQGDGSTWKDLTTDASGGDYDTDAPVDADGNFVILEAKADDLDIANGFYQVRLYVAEAGNTGVDNITAFIFGYNPRDAYAERNAAAVSGEKVYVTPS